MESMGKYFETSYTHAFFLLSRVCLVIAPGALLILAANNFAGLNIWFAMPLAIAISLGLSWVVLGIVGVCFAIYEAITGTLLKKPDEEEVHVASSVVVLLLAGTLFIQVRLGGMHIYGGLLHYCLVALALTLLAGSWAAAILANLSSIKTQIVWMAVGYIVGGVVFGLVIYLLQGLRI